MKCTSLMSKDIERWTVLFRNTPPSDCVYMWGSGNPHVHVKHWHLWWKREKKDKLSEGEREGDGERETEIEWVLDPLLLSHYRTSTLIWTSFELIFQSVLASKESSNPDPSESMSFWKQMKLQLYANFHITQSVQWKHFCYWDEWSAVSWMSCHQVNLPSTI